MDNWPSDLPKPKQILAGSGVNSLGSGLELAAAVDASIERLDHQWNYIGGIPHPSGNNDGRGLRFFVEPGTADLGIYVNELGQRFTNECSSVKTNLAKVLAQPNQRYWYVFDANNKTNLRAGGIGWTKKSIERNIFSNPRLVKVADSVAALAGLMQVNPKALQTTIKRYNLMANRGSDSDFGRFGPQHPAHGCSIASALATPPYYAIQRLPLSRKSMGGIQVDLETHVLNVAGKKIPGLYAVGEVTGFAGINGRAGLEGTFLGPSIVMGRVAGRVIASEIRPGPAQDILAATELVTLDMTQNEAVCSDCHQLPTDGRTSRPGYEHFGWVHQLVQGRQQPCALCHSDLMPLSLTAHRSNLLQQINTCTHCHGGGD